MNSSRRPDFAWAARWADGFEQAEALMWSRFAGVILMEAMKHTYAPVARARPARLRARGSFQPAPIGGKIGVASNRANGGRR